MKTTPDHTGGPERRHERWVRWLAVPLLAALLLFLGWAHYRFLTAGNRYADRDFMSLWAGGRALWEGLDPYDPETWVALRASYGGTWMPDVRAPFPLWTLMLVSPLSVLPLDKAAAVWQVLLELALAAALLLQFSSAQRRRPRRLEALLILLGAFTMRGTLVTLTNGQITLLLLLALSGGLVLLTEGRPFYAGLALSLVALKPNPFILFAPLLGLWLLRQRRWRAIAGSLTGAALLVGASLIVRRGWLVSWLTVRGKTDATFRTPTLWGMAHLLAPEAWPAVGLALAIGVTAATGWLLLRRDERDPARVIGLAICTSLLVTPYVWAYEHALLLLPIGLVFVTARRPWQAWAVWGTLTCALPWLLFWVATQLGGDALSALVPAVTGIALLAATRKASPVSQERPEP